MPAAQSDTLDRALDSRRLATWTSLLRSSMIRINSALSWTIAAGWSIPLRSIADSWLFVPTAGELVVHTENRSVPLRPGQALLMPPGLPHAIGYHWPAERRGAMLSVHFAWHDQAQRSVLERFDARVVPLPEQRCRSASLRRLIALVNADHEIHAPALCAWLLDVFAALVLDGAVDPRPLPPTDGDAVVDAALRLMDERMGEGIAVAEIAAAVGASPSRLRARFVAAIGRSPQQVLAAKRIDRAQRLLRRTGWPAAAIAERCGFATVRYFHQAFKRATGRTPMSCRNAPVES